MFRESDEKPKVLHPTFTTKPVPILQAISQVGKFDDDARSTSSSRNALNSEIPAVPVTRDTYYDPSHPDADWVKFLHLTRLCYQEILYRHEFRLVWLVRHKQLKRNTAKIIDLSNQVLEWKKEE